MINSKFILAKKQTVFEELISTIPAGLDPIVFIEDSRKLWFHGVYFDIGTPAVSFTSTASVATLKIGETPVKLIAGTGINFSQAETNGVNISTNALLTIGTDENLNWDSKLKVLSLVDNGIIPGNYGQISDVQGNSFNVPFLQVNSKGLIYQAANRTITVPYDVEQLLALNDTGKHNLLLGFSNNSDGEVGKVRKAVNLQYDTSLQQLLLGTLESPATLVIQGAKDQDAITVPNGNITLSSGMFIGKFEGDLTGSATPKLHLSDTGEYGGASTKLYGHTKLLDDFPVIEPEKSSTNDSIIKEDVVAIAASPWMVWKGLELAKAFVTGTIDTILNLANEATNDNVAVVNSDKTIGTVKSGTEGQVLTTVGGKAYWRTPKGIHTVNTDEGNFVETSNVITINGKGGTTVKATKSGVQVSSVKLAAKNRQKELVSLSETLEFSEDFEVKNNKLSIRWEYL